MAFGAALGVLLPIDIFIFISNRKRYLADWWNVVSLLNYILFAYNLSQSMTVSTKVKELGKIIPMSENAATFPWQGISDVRQFLQFINAFNAPLSWLRVLKYLEELSPKTRQLTQTVGKAGPDLLVLGVVFLVVYFGFAIGYFLAYGDTFDDFSTFSKSLIRLSKNVLCQRVADTTSLYQLFPDCFLRPSEHDYGCHHGRL
mmetsp:Transcript_16910/g.35743  ORF Transcript_16910/g.35743 Transcript_16910/m.35743 type:complete len:201 (+) Transcript_16910:384-986(+)